LVLLQHFSGYIDEWDPAVVNPLALDRPVIAFDNAGVGRSSCTMITTDKTGAVTTVSGHPRRAQWLISCRFSQAIHRFAAAVHTLSETR
jgi:hypothetical protein